ncbi:MAG: hypothetical protein J1E63_06820 [Muribaculaceae bacterium]|nr:hypothetical protein [Muribaculaceae bacterium]
MSFWKYLGFVTLMDRLFGRRTQPRVFPRSSYRRHSDLDARYDRLSSRIDELEGRLDELDPDSELYEDLDDEIDSLRDDLYDLDDERYNDDDDFDYYDDNGSLDSYDRGYGYGNDNSYDDDY